MMSYKKCSMGLCVCPRCHFETTKTDTYMDHLKRKKPCPSMFSDETQETIINTFKNKTTDCPYCKQAFSASRQLSKHEKMCKMKDTMDIMHHTIEELVEKVQILEKKVVAVSNVNIQNNFNITVNNFGAEDRSYVTQEIMQQCLDLMKISPLVESVYFNPAHPENHTIKLKSEKQKRVFLFQEGTWMEGDMNASIDSMMHRENSSLSSYFYETIWPDQSIDFENKTFTHKRLIRINDKNKDFFEQRREIQAKLKNNLLLL